MPAPFPGGIRVFAVQRLRHYCDSNFGPFTVPDQNLITLEVDILYPQVKTFHQPQPGTVQERSHDVIVGGELGKYQSDLGASEHDGQTLRFTCADHLPEITDVTRKHLTIQKKQPRERLVLGGRPYLLGYRQVSEKRVDFRFGARRIASTTRLSYAVAP